MPTVKKILKPISKEFRTQNCGFNHGPPDDFLRSQWQSRTKSVAYVIYRWIVAIFFLAVVITSMALYWMRGRFFIYFTNWGIMLCMITNLFGAILVSVWYFHPKYSEQLEMFTSTDGAPLSFRIYWALHTTTLSTSLTVTIIYWGILYSMFMETIPVNALNIFEHAFNSILMIIDLFIVAFPLRIYHMFLSIGFVMCFAIFSVIFYFAGGTDIKGNHYIYPILDWSKPDQAMITVGLVAVLFAIYPFILFLLYKLRVFIHTRYKRRKMDLPPSYRFSFENNGFNNDGIPRTSL